MKTGWTGEPPDEQVPDMPLSAMVLRTKQREPGDTLAIALARSQAQERREAREAAAEAVDPDARAAEMIGRGLLPGQVSDLAQRLDSTLAELQAEQEKIERGEKMARIAQREHAAGRLDVWAMQRMLDGDFGDAQRAARLERRAEGLRRELAETSAMISPEQRRAPDPLEAASRRAHQVFTEITRQRMADAQAGRPVTRPFASAGRSAADAAECAGPACEICAEGRRRDAARGDVQVVRTDSGDWSYDKRYDEITRLGEPAAAVYP